MKNFFLIIIIALIGSCCSKQEDCKCRMLIMNLAFECYSEKELSDFQIIKYDSSTGSKISSTKIDFIRPSSGGAQYNINLETDTKYDIEFVNRPLGISRRFSEFTFAIADYPQQCADCKTKIRYKTCHETRYINFLVNGKPPIKKTNRSDDPTMFYGLNQENCLGITP